MKKDFLLENVKEKHVENMIQRNNVRKDGGITIQYKHKFVIVFQILIQTSFSQFSKCPSNEQFLLIYVYKVNKNQLYNNSKDDSK